MKTLYLCMRKQAYLPAGQPITLGDVCAYHVDEADTAQALGGLPIGVSAGAAPYFVSQMDILVLLDQAYHGAFTCLFSGESGTWVLQNPGEAPARFLAVKILVICFILFFGGVLTIMNFHADVNMLQVQKQITAFITGDPDIPPLYYGIAYSVGIGLGVLFFCNMLPGNKKNKEPNLFEIEAEKYRRETEAYKRSRIRKERDGA